MAIGAYWGVVIVAVVATPAHADTVTVTAEADYWFTVDADSTQTIVYGNSNRECEEPGADPYLWLYDATDTLIALDDDSNHGAGQCVSAKLFVTLDAGHYRVRAGYYPEQQGIGYEGGSYTLESVFTLSGTTTTTTTLPPTTTTSTTTTTTPTTTTSTTTTTTPTTTTSTTTTTTTTLPPTTTSTTTTTTTLPPTTTLSTSTTTTTMLAPTTTTSSASTSTTTTSTTTTTTVLETTTTTVPTPPTSTPPAPTNDAPETVKETFENKVNVYATPGYDDYQPANSTVTVATRRTVTAASVVLGTVPTFAPRRRTR